MKGIFYEWCESQKEFFKPDLEELMLSAYEAGYNQRSSEVAEELRLFRGLMDGIRLDPEE